MIAWERHETSGKFNGWKAPTWRTTVGNTLCEVYLGKGGWHYAIGQRDPRRGINAGSWLYAREARAACEAKLRELGLLEGLFHGRTDRFTVGSEAVP